MPLPLPQVSCIPVPKLHDRAHKVDTPQVRPQCHSDFAARFAKIYLAIEQLAEDCGLTGEGAEGRQEGAAAEVPSAPPGRLHGLSSQGSRMSVLPG